MAVLPGKFWVPDEIMEMIADGVCVFEGGAVRIAAGVAEGGRIVKLIDIIEFTPEAKGLIELMKEHKKLLVVGGIAGAAAAGYYIYRKHKKREQMDPERNVEGTETEWITTEESERGDEKITFDNVQ